MMGSTFNQTNEACQVTKLRRWHAIAWSMESMLWKAFPMQLRWSETASADRTFALVSMALIGSPHGCPVLPASANMALLGRLSAQCAAIRCSYYVHYILCRTNAWNILTDLQGSMQMILWMQNNGAWMLCMHCIYLQLHKARRLSWK